MEIPNRLLYDGKRINDDDTPASLDMEDGGTVLFFWHLFAHRSDMIDSISMVDTIDVKFEQTAYVMFFPFLLPVCFPF